MNNINTNDNDEMEAKVKELDNLIFPYFIDATKERVLEIQEWCDGSFDVDTMRENLKNKRAVLARKLLMDIWAGNNRIDPRRENYYWTILRNTMCGVSRKNYEDKMGDEYLLKRNSNGVRDIAWKLYKQNHLISQIPYDQFKDYIETIVPEFNHGLNHTECVWAVAEDIEKVFDVKLAHSHLD